jgi:excinuclease ABC subunit B
MAKAQKTASGNRTPRSKAARPEITPLGEHLAALLNPALNERQPGVSEAAPAQWC